MNSYSRLPVVVSPRGSPPRVMMQQHQPVVYMPISPIKFQHSPQRLAHTQLLNSARISQSQHLSYPVDYTEIPHRQPYLDENDSQLYPSELPYYQQQINSSHQLTHNFGNFSNLMSHNRSFSNVVDMTFQQGSVGSVNELPPPMTREEHEEYEESVREVQFRKRIDSLDRWFDESKQELARDRGANRDFLREFDMIVCNRF